jgi:hypothetical protein
MKIGRTAVGSVRADPVGASCRPGAGTRPRVGPAQDNSIDDRRVMAVAIPAFGLLIPPIAGLYGSMSWRQPMLWAGAAYFLLLSALVWFGNRWLLFKQRARYSIPANPKLKLATLVGQNVLFTVLVTGSALLAWFEVNSMPIDMRAVQLVIALVVLVVIFVTYAYDSVFLMHEREFAVARYERLERNRAQAELEALTAQLDPHFLFNCLNTLGHLIDTGPSSARRFCDKLASVYRYVLAARGRQLVSLEAELGFLLDNFELLRLRFGESIELRVDAAVTCRAADSTVALPPLSLQTLLENAVKHNRLAADEPLSMEVFTDDATISFGHESRPRMSSSAGDRLGLRILDERCRLLTGRGISIVCGDGRFVVSVPLARL